MIVKQKQFGMGIQLFKWNQNYMIINTERIDTEIMICYVGGFLDKFKKRTCQN